jgi:hypothetical protein
MRLLFGLADNRSNGTVAARMRKGRHSLFLSLLDQLPSPVTILDVGGTEDYWNMLGFPGARLASITLLNLTFPERSSPQFSHVTGDARQMSEFRDHEFDAVFSNSVIEHVGGHEDQARMAAEIMRIGRCYFVQTPNYYFPIEAHYLFPFFQFLPVHLRAWLLSKRGLGWIKRIPDLQEARIHVESIHLLRKRELLSMFPGAFLYQERVFGLTKSFVVVGGWHRPSAG